MDTFPLSITIVTANVIVICSMGKKGTSLPPTLVHETRIPSVNVLVSRKCLSLCVSLFV